MKTLDELARECGTDKSSETHNYAAKYDQYLSQYRDADIKFFEIGIQYGYSIKMWKKYFNKAQIYALDIQDCKHMEEDRVHVLVGSQNDPNLLTKISNDHGPFDVIVDDGSHHNESMYISFETLFPLLKPGGLYIIEDLTCCYWPWIQKDVNQNFNNVLKSLVDHVNASGFTGIGSRVNDHKDPVYKQSSHNMSWWDKNVEYMHLYRNIVFIKKYDEL
jgi:demethylmacrocin O-methyltransferase